MHRPNEIDLVALKYIYLGSYALQGKMNTQGYVVMRSIIWILFITVDLYNLSSIVSKGYTFCNSIIITLESKVFIIYANVDIPNVSFVDLPNSLIYIAQTNIYSTIITFISL